MIVDHDGQARGVCSASGCVVLVAIAMSKRGRDSGEVDVRDDDILSPTVSGQSIPDDALEAEHQHKKVCSRGSPIAFVAMLTE